MSSPWKRWSSSLILVATWVAMMSAAALATGEWREELARICCQADVASELSSEELTRLVQESDTLLLQLEKIKPDEAKVAIFRLKKSRDFFQYLLQFRAAGAKENQPAD